MVTLVRYVLLALPNIAAYAIFAIGIVTIFRASRVLNIAHGAMAMIPAYLVYEMNKRGIPIAVAFVLGVIAGGLVGLFVERAFVRPLRDVSVTAQTVGTVAALGLMVAFAGKVWGTGTTTAPVVIPRTVLIESAGFDLGELGLVVVMLLITGGLVALLQFTDIGLAMRGAADNRRAASLMGVDPDVATSGAWIIGGATAAVAGILLASVTNLNPLVLSLQAIPAFVAALLGGLGSLYGAVIGAVIVGGATGLVPWIETLVPSLANLQGKKELVLGFMALAVMAARGERYAASDIRSGL